VGVVADVADRSQWVRNLERKIISLFQTFFFVATLFGGIEVATFYFLFLFTGGKSYKTFYGRNL
jgi:hypothetical protein